MKSKMTLTSYNVKNIFIGELRRLRMQLAIEIDESTGERRKALIEEYNACVAELESQTTSNRIINQ